MQNNTEMSEEEYLRQHLQSLESAKEKKTAEPKVKVEVEASSVENLKYFSFDVREFPCNLFYPAGTTIQIRAAEVREIQAYSMVDDNNYYDIVEKMNEMLAACVRVKYADGRVGSYTELKDPDRFWAIFCIRELTFQQGNNLAANATCTCGQEHQIELKRENLRSFDIDEKMKRFYDNVNNCFTFETTMGQVYHLAPPSIGLQKAFTEYIVKENSEKRKPNLAFLKIIPFLLSDRHTISQEGIKAKLTEFTKLNNNSFQFLNSAVDKLTFGIQKAVITCSCGEEVHSDKIFPDGPSAIFVVHDAFERYIKE
jgi:hypothetical protein